MQKKCKFLILIGIMVFAFACQQEPIDQQPVDDSTPPDPVTNVEVENVPGGGVLNYELPDDEDLLYIKGEFSRFKGSKAEEVVSMYNDSMRVEGFGDTLSHDVDLVAVDRNGNVSDTVTATIKPLEPPVISIGKSLELIQDFGGVHAYWENESRAQISVILGRYNENLQEYEQVEAWYSSVKEGEGTARGMDTLQYPFEIFVQDRWGNTSEPKYDSITPLYETEFDKFKFSNVQLPGDVESAWGWVRPNLFDDDPGSGFHTGYTGWPQSFTMDLGVTGKISRVKLFQRGGQWYYDHGNIKAFELYGAKTLDESGDWDNWIKMGEFESTKPSELPLGEVSNEDLQYIQDGEEFILSPEKPRVRYLRFLITESWSGGKFFHVMEIDVFGDNRPK